MSPLTVLLLLALLALAYSKKGVSYAGSSDNDDDSSANHGVDDDDTDKSDEAGRKAWNHANNVEMRVTNRIEKAAALCPYWPRASHKLCTVNVASCIVAKLARSGEMSDHLTLVHECASPNSSDYDNDGYKKAKDAYKRAKDFQDEVLEFVLQQERWAKKFCAKNDDPCKNNVECLIMRDVTHKYPDSVASQDCDIEPIDLVK